MTVKTHLVPVREMVFSVMFPEHEEQNKILKEKIFDIKEKNPESVDVQTDNTGWHSSYFLHTEYDEFDRLMVFAQKVSDWVAKTHHRVPAEFDVYNMWAMTYDEGNQTHQHHHFPAAFSAVYFVDVEPNAAPLMFGETKITPINGLLVVFPGILMHSVPPTDGKRVIVSMNLEGDSKEKFKMTKRYG